MAGKRRGGGGKEERAIIKETEAKGGGLLMNWDSCFHAHTHTCTHTQGATASMCHQNEAGSYAKQTIRGVPPGAKQPIMAAPVCVTSQQEAELGLVSSQSPAEWLISLLDWRGDRMLNVQLPL